MLALSLPFVVEAYPDEIFGSWLARIALHNGPGAWRTLVETAGYYRKFACTCFGGAPHSEKFDTLLSILGTSYDVVVHRLTLLPYWLVFDSAPLTESALPGSSSEPKLFKRSFLDRVGFVGPNKSLTPRWCPECLANDRRRHGEVYWHRSHQLPNVFVCHLHECMLRTNCKRCGAAVHLGKRRLVSLPNLRCDCGAELSGQGLYVNCSEAYTRLVRISCSALQVEKVSWDYESVRRSVEAIGKKASGEGRGWYATLLANAYDASVSSATIRSARLFLDGDEKSGGASLKFSLRSGRPSSAPDCVAILAAANQTLSKAIDMFKRRNNETTSPKTRPTIHHGSVDMKTARRVFLEYEGSSLTQHGMFASRCYWYLRLFDMDWLRDHRIRAPHRSTPSIEEDRVELRNVASALDIRPSLRHKRLQTSPAGLRASLRDVDFFKRFKRDTRSEMAKEVRGGYEREAHARALRLISTVSRILQEENRPRRIDSAILARESGLSQGQVIAAMQKNPQLRTSINEANEGKYRRQIMWATLQLRAANKRSLKGDILRQAGLPPTKQTSALVKWARDVVLETSQ